MTGLSIEPAVAVPPPDKPPERKPSWWRIRRGAGSWPLYVGLVVLLALVIVPIVQLILMSLRTGSLIRPGPLTLENYRTALNSGATWEVLGNTLVFAVSVTLISLVLAGIFAWLTERTDLPLRNTIWSLILLPMAVPPVLFAMSWTFLLTPRVGYLNVLTRRLFGIDSAEGPFDINTLPGMIFVMTLSGVPTIFLMIAGSMRLMDPALEDAARVGGASQWRSARKISLALLFPAFLIAGMYSFVGVLENFDVPLVLGIPGDIQVLSTLIYFTAQLRVPAEYGLAAVYSVLFMAIGVACVLVYRRLVRLGNRYATVRGKAYKPRRIPLGKWKYPALALVALYLLLALVLPVGMLVWRSLTPIYIEPSVDAFKSVSLSNYSVVLADPRFDRAVVNTLLVMLSVGLLTMVLSLVASWFVVRRGGFLGRFVDSAVFVTIGVPSIVTALAMIALFVGTPARNLGIYGTILVLIPPLIIAYIAYGSRVTNTAMTQVHGELEEAALVSGAGMSYTLRRITLPLILPAFLSGFVWVAVHSMRTVTTPLLLYNRENVVVSVLLWLHWDAGRPGVAAALGVMLTAFLLVLTVASRRTMQRILSR